MGANRRCKYFTIKSIFRGDHAVATIRSVHDCFLEDCAVWVRRLCKDTKKKEKFVYSSAGRCVIMKSVVLCGSRFYE